MGELERAHEALQNADLHSKLVVVEGLDVVVVVVGAPVLKCLRNLQTIAAAAAVAQVPTASCDRQAAPES